VDLPQRRTPIQIAAFPFTEDISSCLGIPVLSFAFWKSRIISCIVFSILNTPAQQCTGKLFYQLMAQLASFMPSIAARAKPGAVRQRLKPPPRNA
jgi:hypothetical protein